jgi:two-component system response regulator QseB
VRILLIEDDPLLGDALRTGLRELGLLVDWLRDGVLAEEALQQTPYDVVVLDLGLPRKDGMQVLNAWRSRGDVTPVLILTAREGLDARIEGLDTGADDYLVKPVNIAELAARLRALVRRSQGRVERVWRHGALEYNPAARTATWQGRPLDLTNREMGLLEVLLANPNRVLSKAHIQEKLYDWSEELESNTLEVYVHHLRRKIDPGIVRTVRGVGYMLGPAQDSA